MTENHNKSEIHPFDLNYLKSITEDLQVEVKKRGEVMVKMETHMATTNVILGNLTKKSEEHESKLTEHDGRIRSAEMAEAHCEAPTVIKQHDRELKTLNAFMNYVKRGDGNDINTGVVDTHAQQMQAAAEQAIVNSLPIRLHLAKSWPIIILIAIFCVVITTLIMARVVTGQEMEFPEINDVPGLEIRTNSSSQENKDEDGFTKIII